MWKQATLPQTKQAFLEATKPITLEFHSITAEVLRLVEDGYIAAP